MRLLDLDDDVQHEIARILLKSCVRDALRFAQACRLLRQRLLHVISQAQMKRLAWQPAKQTRVTNHHRTLTRVSEDDSPEADTDFAVGQVLLPTEGQSSFKIRVECSAQNGGRMFVGVCTGDATLAAPCITWCLHLGYGVLYREAHVANGGVTSVALPDGWPDGNHKLIMKDLSGRPAGLRGSESAAVSIPGTPPRVAPGFAMPLLALAFPRLQRSC